ncbi:hypothetical protein C8R43DRAFT_635402 [Mycena crocata]|nr:hypothetical protein C8R43DRAFT_635402 [Mycena crocata]
MWSPLTSPRENYSEPSSAKSSSSVFEGCTNFTVSGGTFEIRNPQSPEDRSDYRTIRPGDLNLLTEIGKEDIVEYHEVRRQRTGALVRRHKVIVGTRRIHQARIFGNPERVTVVVYKGPQFDKWKAEAEQREHFRHPSVFQLFGITKSPALNALVYTDGM